MNILFDADHYKLALAQLLKARNLVDAIAKDYCKLLEFGDTSERFVLFSTLFFSCSQTFFAGVRS